MGTLRSSFSRSNAPACRGDRRATKEDRLDVLAMSHWAFSSAVEGLTVGKRYQVIHDDPTTQILLNLCSSGNSSKTQKSLLFGHRVEGLNGLTGS